MKASGPIRVVIVDDSPTARRALARCLDAAADITVVGEAATGARALAAIADLAPDLVTLDVHLGEEDGVEIAARIMSTSPVPILIVTGIDPHDPTLAFRAIQAGALDVIGKPPAPGSSRYDHERDRLVRLIRSLSGVPVVTRRPRRVSVPPDGTPAPTTGPCGLVVLGASTGGPQALEVLLSALPRPFPIPVVIAQHISPGFSATMAAWLGAATGRRVIVCAERCALEPDMVVIAGDDTHLRVGARGVVEPDHSAPRAFHRPSIDTLFESAALHYGPRAAGVLLTGMGRDGAEGLGRLRRAGAVTMVQDPASCVVGSMPTAALELGAADSALSLSQIAVRLSRLLPQA